MMGRAASCARRSGRVRPLDTVVGATPYGRANERRLDGKQAQSCESIARQPAPLTNPLISQVFLSIRTTKPCTGQDEARSSTPRFPSTRGHLESGRKSRLGSNSINSFELPPFATQQQSRTIQDLCKYDPFFSFRFVTLLESPFGTGFEQAERRRQETRASPIQTERDLHTTTM